MIEVHARPAEAKSDAAQALTPEDFAELAADLRLLHGVLHPHPAETAPRG
jgi:3-deoxy-D-arabino-heptulosonate 7-phosphate (DAHP) synthase